MKELVNINKAGFIELQRIIHIGPVRAAEIIERRKTEKFRDVHEISNIDRLGKKRMEDILAQGIITV